MKPRRILATILTAASATILPAATLTWDGDPATPGVQQGGGTWNTSANNWWDGSGNVIWNNETPDTAVFDTGAALTANVTVSIGEAITAAGLSLAPRDPNLSYIITGSAPITLTDVPDIEVVNTGTGGTIRIESPIVGAFNKTGNGRLVLSNNNSGLTGTVTVKADRLQLGNNTGSGSVGTAAVNLDGSSAQLVFRRSNSFTFTNAVSGNGRVVFQLNSATAITLNPSSPWSYNGTTTLEPTGSNITGGKLILGNHERLPAATRLTLNRNGTTSLLTFDLNGFNQQIGGLISGTGVTPDNAVVTNTKPTTSTLTVSGAVDSTFSGLVSGNLNLVKGDLGKLTLTGANTYTGSTSVIAGTLSVTGPNLSDTAVVALAQGAVLDLDFAGNDTVGGLIIDGTAVPAGTYDANHPQYGPYFTGAGSLTVPAPPPFRELTWDSDPLTQGVQGSNGTWDITTNNWWFGASNTIWSNLAPDRAVFDAGAALTTNVTVNLGAPITAGRIAFFPRQTALTFTIGGTEPLTLLNTPDIEITGGTSRIDCPVTGSFNKAGNGRLIISSNNPAYAGTVTNPVERLQIGNGGPTGSLGTATIVNDGTLIFRRTGVYSIETAVSGGGGTLVQLYSTNTPVTLNPAVAMTYSGNTTIEPSATNAAGGVLALGNHDRFPATTRLTLNRNGDNSLVTFDLNGFNQQVAAIATGTGVTDANAVITNSSATASTLTVSGDTDTTFDGLLAGNLNLTKGGVSILTLTANHTRTGNTKVTEGVLSIAHPCLGDYSTLTIEPGAAIELNYTGTDTVAAATLGGTALDPGVYGDSHPVFGSFIDGEGTITVTGAVQDDYSTWTASFPGFTDTATTSDPDGDGLSNFEEYAFGLNPTLGSSSNPVTTSLTPAGNFSYTRRDPALSKLSHEILTSTDLVTWIADAGAIQTPGPTDANGVQTVVVQLAASPQNGRIFARVRAY
jgi:autotransporter-associated beta strand protein